MSKSFYGICAFLILIFAASSAYSCSCEKYSQRREFRRAKSVFIGEFVRFGGDNQTGTLVELKITKSWKGHKAGRAITLSYIDLDGCDYDMNFAAGKRYLIYAVASDSRGLFVSVDCGGSRAVEDAAKDIGNLDKIAGR